MAEANPNACLSGNECISTPGDDTQVTVTISPYFPVRNYKSLANNGRSWLGAPGSAGDYGHSRQSQNGGVRSHAGCDIYVDVQGEPVYAVKSGTIIGVLPQATEGWGQTQWIAIDHGDFIARYCEVGNLQKTSGQVVQGEIIAKVKTTTFSPQPMLHFEMFDKSESGAFDQPPNLSKMVNNRPTKRRKDLIDPTSKLEQWVNNIPPEC